MPQWVFHPVSAQEAEPGAPASNPYVRLAAVASDPVFQPPSIVQSGTLRSALERTLARIDTCLDEVGILRLAGPKHPRFATRESRVATFKNWPAPEIQTPEKLALAGFFHAPVQDSPDAVICFYCNGGIREWVREDDPWEIHAKYYGKCGFLQLEVGAEFVRSVQAKWKNPPPASPKEEPSAVAAAAPSEEQNCIICLGKERQIVFLPCGHFVTCARCATAFSKCVICRKELIAVIRAYLS